MATFRFVGRDINIHWNGYDIKGPAGTVFSIPDQLYEEFEGDLRGAEPSLEWIDTNEFLTLTNAVSVTTLDGTFPISSTTTSAGKNISIVSTSASDGYVLTANGAGGVAWEPLPGDATGITNIIGTSPISAAVSGTSATISLTANYQTAGTYVTGVAGSSPISATGTTAITISIDQSAITSNSATNAEVIRTYVKNTSGSTMTKGQAVYVSGADGTNVTISLSSASTEATSSKTIGLLAQDLANNAFGYVIESGLIAGIDTSAATAGQSVWLGDTAGSRVYGAPPSDPSHSVYLGVVARSNVNNGEILVQVQNGYELDELHDVFVNGVSTALPLVYNSTSSGWVAQALTSVGIADNAVVASKIASGAVGSSALADNAVVAAKIAAGSVGTSAISSGSASSGLVLSSNGIGGVSFTTAAAGFNGPVSSIDNSITRFDGTGGKTVQGSSVIVDDSNDVFFPSAIAYSPVSVSLATNTYTINLASGIFFNGITAGSRIDPTFVTSRSIDFGAATSGSVVGPTGMLKGDTVVVAIGSDGGTAALVNSSAEAGLTKVLGGASGTAYGYIFIGTLTVDNQTALGTVSGLLTASTAVVFVFRGVSTWENIRSSSGASGMPTPPSLIASSTTGRVGVVAGFLDDDSIGGVTAPSGFLNIASQSSSATGFTTMIAWADISATTQTVAAFGGSGTDEWLSGSLVLIGSRGDRTVTLSSPPSQAISGFLDAKAHTIIIRVVPGSTADAVSITWDSKIVWSGQGAPASDVASLVVLTTYDGLVYYGTYSTFV